MAFYLNPTSVTTGRIQISGATLSDNAGSNATGVTFSAWCSIPGNTTSSGSTILFGMTNSGNGGVLMEVVISITNISSGIWETISGNGHGSSIVTGTSVTYKQVGHLCCVADFTGTNKVTLYWNGAIVVSGTASSTPGNTLNLSNITYLSGMAIWDDVRIYNIALPIQEVFTIYNAKGSDKVVNGLQHRYKMIDQAASKIKVTTAIFNDSGPMGTFASLGGASVAGYWTAPLVTHTSSRNGRYRGPGAY